jgi:hypothetical protein
LGSEFGTTYIPDITGAKRLGEMIHGPKKAGDVSRAPRSSRERSAEAFHVRLERSPQRWNRDEAKTEKEKKEKKHTSV